MLNNIKIILRVESAQYLYHFVECLQHSNFLRGFRIHEAGLEVGILKNLAKRMFKTCQDHDNKHKTLKNEKF